MYKTTGSTGICSIDADKCTSDCINVGCSDKTKCTNVGYKWINSTTGGVGTCLIDEDKCTSASTDDGCSDNFYYKKYIELKK